MEVSFLILCSNSGKNGAREGPELLQGKGRVAGARETKAQLPAPLIWQPPSAAFSRVECDTAL
jgi:hypothetical protein